MLGYDINRFGLSTTNGLSDCYRTTDIISQIRFSQAHIYILLTQFRIMSEQKSEDSEKERERLFDRISSEIRYLITTFEAYKKIRDQSYVQDNIEGILYSSYRTTQNNIQNLLQIASEILRQRLLGHFFILSSE